MTTNLLALETSGRSGSVVVSRTDLTLEDLQRAFASTIDAAGLLERVTMASLELDPRWGSAKTLAPAIQRLLGDLGMQTSDLQAIAVVQGPGSFTGLRVGIATAKVMAYALGIPLVAVDTLDVIADQIATDPQVRAGDFDLIATIDAFRGQSFWGRYQISDGLVAKTTQTLIDDNGDLAREIARWPDTGELVVAGPSMAKLQESTQEFHQGAASTSGAHQRLVWAECRPQAASVAKLGWRALAAGHRADVFGLLPNYYRSSAAEEKRSG